MDLKCKKIWIGIGLLVLLITAAFYFLNLNKPNVEEYEPGLRILRNNMDVE